jgi:hypothetical protein
MIAQHKCVLLLSSRSTHYLHTSSPSAICALPPCVESLSPIRMLILHTPSSLLFNAPLLYASYSYKVVALHNNQGVCTLSPRSVLVLLMESLLDTISSMERLFVGLSSYTLHSRTTSTPALPLGVVLFLFILDPTLVTQSWLIIFHLYFPALLYI